MLGAGIGLGVVGTLDGRSSYVPMSINIPLDALTLAGRRSSSTPPVA